MTNKREEIYLQVIDEENQPSQEITWCENRIRKSDIAYVRKDWHIAEQRKLLEKIHEALNRQAYYTDCPNAYNLIQDKLQELNK